MKYVAIFEPAGLRLAETFERESDAQAWLDSYNNNADHDTVIDMYDDNGKFVDGYYYTQSAR